MKKGKIGLLFIIVVVVVLIAVIFISNNKKETEENIVFGEDGTGLYYNLTTKINGYTINIDSASVGKVENGSYFSTDFKIIDNGIISFYNVKYVDIVTSNIVTPEDEIKIGDKKFKYMYSDNGVVATLYYEIPNENAVVVIKVMGDKVYKDTNSNTNAGELAKVNTKVLESSELAGIVNFTISL